ncbi:ATPase PAAT isoform X2 [Esox lucius]|uniref:ATPase PAAT isoform X2 n=1 Tax=Esox lucius TaxID=8010 RepID=UPI000576E3D6|nr:ATPase PAAT isoform X2 [Esox lucius]
MASIDVNTSKGRPVSGHTSWACISQEIQLSDILLSVQLTDDTDLSQFDRDTPDRCLPVLLEQVEEGSPCVLTLACAPHCPALITSLLVTSEARTIEVYSLAGDYCGTCRGESQPDTPPDSAERGPFYRKQLILECPTQSCSVKLLSLGGRSSVAVARIVTGLQMPKPADGCPSLGPSIDMLRVRSMMEEMGTTLSPGAQGLMDMVQMQQKSKADALSGLLPLLMSGGALSALAKGMNRPPATTPDNRPQPSVNHTPPPDEMSRSVSPDPGPECPVAPGSPADLATPSLSGVPGGRRPCIGPDMLPMLQSVCGQVTRLRIEDAAKTSDGPRKEHACCRELEQMMERRLEQMERRLMEHMDQRLDSLQQRLETALLQALPLALPLNHLKTTVPTLDQNHSVQSQALH